MEKLFSDLEGLRMAMEIETRGREFYQKAADKAEKPEHRDLFILLRDEEKHHLETFTTMFLKIKETKEAHSDDYLFDTDTSRYLTVLVEEHIFPKKEKAAAKIDELQTIETILNAAIQAEKDSILFYDELAINSKFEDAKKIFLTLKAEEQTHVVKLREMLDAWA